MIGAAEVHEVAAGCTAFLRGHLEADWSATIPDIDLRPTGVAAHVAEVCLWYSIDLSARGADLTCVEQRVDAGADPELLIDTLAAHVTLLAAAVAAADEGARGFHPWGMADASGFAAMACDELLIHTDDVARGWGVTFGPPPDLAEAVLHRLFPWVDGNGDPWELLRWANGRVSTDGRDRLERWRWHCAPLDEWDGELPDWW